MIWALITLSPMAGSTCDLFPGQGAVTADELIDFGFPLA